MQLVPDEQAADIVVTAPQGKPLLVVEVKRRPIISKMLEQLRDYAQAIGAKYIMAVDPQHIIIAQSHNGFDSRETVTLITREVLRPYTDADLLRVEGFYLESLIESWLRDFSFSWKSAKPPGYDELTRIGLASLLRDSETRVKR